MAAATATTAAATTAASTTGCPANGTVVIPSQHYGNCASDTLQIILFFADGFRDVFRDIRQPVVTVASPPEQKYLFFAIRRYDELLRGPRTLGLQRLPSYSNQPLILTHTDNTATGQSVLINTGPELYAPGTISIGLESNPERKIKSLGEICSVFIGDYLRPRFGTTPRYSTDYWRFLPRLNVPEATTAYLEFYNKVVKLGGPNFVVSAFLEPEEEMYISAFQVLTFNTVNDFHTFSILKYNGCWCIGDDMIGYLVKIKEEMQHRISQFSEYTITTFEAEDAASSMITKTYSMKRRNGASQITEVIASITYPKSPTIGGYHGQFEEKEMSGIAKRYYYYSLPTSSSSSAASVVPWASAASAAPRASAASAAPWTSAAPRASAASAAPWTSAASAAPRASAVPWASAASAAPRASAPSSSSAASRFTNHSANDNESMFARLGRNRRTMRATRQKRRKSRKIARRY